MVNESYLSNTKVAAQLLGISPLLNPYSSFVSSQRGMMFSSHLQQAQVIKGCEHPRTFTGYESMVGEYEYNTTDRHADAQLTEIIPKFMVGTGAHPINENPYYTIVYRGDDNKVSSFQLEKYTLRSDGFGYENKWLNKRFLNRGNFIPKDMKLSTSPAHDGNKYMMGTNLKTAYMSLPHVTEDAFVISESAAQKLQSEHYGKISFKIQPNQIPVNLYGGEEEIKFLPDIGEHVGPNGVLCALRTPTSDSIISDLSPENMSKIQDLHDTIHYIPSNSKIIDIDVVVNRKCKVKTPKEVFAQVQKYRDQINAYNIKVWEAYQQAVKENLTITPIFNSLVTRCLSSLLADNVRIQGYNKKPNVTLVKRKEPIEFIYITVTYKAYNEVKCGYKLSGRMGNKGVVGAIWPDEYMPVDDHGVRADIIADPISVYNRMNPGQWYELFFNRAAQFVSNRIRDAVIDKNGVMTNNKTVIDSLFEYLIEFLTDMNPKWGEKISSMFNDNRAAFVKEVAEDGIFLQMSPFQDNVGIELVSYISQKYDIGKTPVTYTVPNEERGPITIRTKQAIMIGDVYWYNLYKMPHLRCTGIGYVNQYRGPSKPSIGVKSNSPVPLTPLRFGEDENRSLLMSVGEDEVARIMGTYANSPVALRMLSEHLLFSSNPAKLKRLPITTKEIINTNNINNVSKHIFSCLGIDITFDSRVKKGR